MQKTLEPLAQYWAEEITPAVRKYMETHASINDFYCTLDHYLVESVFYDMNIDDYLINSFETISDGGLYYAMGDLERAFKFDNAFIQTELRFDAEQKKARGLAEKWYHRGETLIALKLDAVYLKQYPSDTKKVILKWCTRLKKGIMLKPTLTTKNTANHIL